MDYKSIQELIKTMSESKLSLLEVEAEGIRIKMEKKSEQIVLEKVSEVAQTSVAEPQLVVQKAEPQTVILQEGVKESNETVAAPRIEAGTLVTAPIVGTFYSASGPDSEPFAKVGKRVKKGETLCIIEAMKLMNEIESEVDGEIAEIYVTNEQMVEYGQPLFRII